jgi:hypothetical protein
MTPTLRLLLVEDSPLDAKLITGELKAAQLQCVCIQVEKPEDLAEQLRLSEWDLVISDYHLPQMDGLQVIGAVAATGKDIPVIVVSGTIGEDTAVAAMQAGADDYLMKDNLRRLGPAVERAIRQAASRREKRQARQDIQRAAGQLEAFFNSSMQANYLLAPDGTIVRLNRIAREHARQFFGQEPRPGDLLTAFITPAQQASFAANLQQCLRGETLFSEHPVRFDQLGTRWYQTKYYPVYDGDGNITGVAYSTFDITGRKQAEAAMQELKLRLEGIITSAMDAIITTNEAQQIVMSNQAAEQMFGYAAHELLNQPIDLLIPQRFRPGHRGHVNQYGASGRTTRQMGVNMTLHGLRSNGREFPIEASISQVEVAGKKYYTVILRDVTLRVEAEKHGKKLNRELIRQNEQLQQFLYITSHNLRGPVATLLGLVGLVERDESLSAHNLHLVESIDKTVHKLDTVIQDLNAMLEYKKELNAHKENVPLQGLTDEITLLLARAVAEAGATIDTDFSGVPALFTVRTYLHSIFYNLLSNAIKYRHPDRPPFIRIRSWRDGEGFVCIRFTDNGLGLDVDRYKESLFGLYQRFHLHVEGKGLGLHLVKTQLEALNGSIEVKSTVGAGSAFTVKLPV